MLYEQLVLSFLHLGELLDVKPPVKAELGNVGVAHLSGNLSLLLQFQFVGYVVTEM